ncbi:hypothetical protein [Clostridium felsineum]|uniref:hypothetical protein n=1 Tax=Clostridium felsineum TaxID=36839 RepID=UPI00098C922E|nr:hypothetical protein [Clostridium felsineum]URZ04650.1 hypothetical protein CLAUR_047390 [Clostridium felsineum]
MDKLKVGDFDGASIELMGMDLENVLNALTIGEVGAAIEGFQTLFKLGTKGLEQIEETAPNIKKEEGIIKTALESARRKLEDLHKIVYDGESSSKFKIEGNNNR